MKKIISILLILLLFSVSTVGKVAKAELRLIADPKEDTSIEKLQEEIKNTDCEINKKLSDTISITCKNKKDIKKLKNFREEKKYMLIKDVPIQDKKAKVKDIWDNEFIKATEVWELGITGKNRTIALLDTGIDYNHIELKSSYLYGYDFVNDDDDPMDDYGHGTHIAGIITSDGINDEFSKGIAPDANIIMAKVCDQDGTCWESDILAGLEWASKQKPDAISLSFGTMETWVSKNCIKEPLARAVNKVARKIPVVVAAGNFPFGVSSPACASNVIAVGSSSYDTLMDFSARGYPMRNHGVIAPGEDVYSTFPGNNYGFMSGTSVSAPYVAGLIALAKEKNNRLSGTRIKRTIFRSANKELSPTYSERSEWEIGYGQIDALKTIENIRKSRRR